MIVDFKVNALYGLDAAFIGLDDFAKRNLSLF
jgi:hypothetical protein